MKPKEIDNQILSQLFLTALTLFYLILVLKIKAQL